MKNMEEIVKNYPDFRYLSSEEIAQLQSRSVKKSYKKGQVLFDMGDVRKSVYFLISGVVKFERTDVSGTFFYLGFQKSKEVFPRVGLFTDENYYISVTAHTDIELIIMPNNLFKEIISNNHKQLLEWVKLQSNLLKLYTTKIQKGTMNNASYRVEMTLAQLFNDLGEKQYPVGTVKIPCPITISDIAKASGSTRETTSLVIKKLIAAKKIKYQHKKIIYLDPSFFMDLLAE